MNVMVWELKINFCNLERKDKPGTSNTRKQGSV